MAVWAIAWAGSKPIASLADGLLANSVGLKWTGALLALPALVPIVVLIALIFFVFAKRSEHPGPDRWPAGRLESPKWPDLLRSASVESFSRAEFLLKMPATHTAEVTKSGAA